MNKQDYRYQKNWKSDKCDFELEIAIVPAIGAGLIVANHQPRKKYKTALWEIGLIILCFHISFEWSYEYKK